MFNSFLIFFGVTTIFVAIGAMTQTIIELEFGDAIGKRRNKRMIEKLKDHYIICGFGRVGRGAAAELQHAGRALRHRRIDAERVERAMLGGMLAVAADSTRDDDAAAGRDRPGARAGGGARHRRRQSVRAALRQGAESENLRRSARGRRRRRGKDAARRGGCGLRALRHHGAPAGAIAAAAARGSVPGFHDQGHR